MTKTVLTHGLSYGVDCSSLKAFAPLLDSKQPRAIGVIDPESTTADEIKSLHASGVRGVRVNLYRYKAMEDVELQKKALLAHLRRITAMELPWNPTMTTTRTDFWDQLEPFIYEYVVPTGVQLVTDHFVLLKAPSMLPGKYRGDPPSQPGFKTIMRLVRSGNLWVKLSAPYRASEQSPHYEDLEFLVREFVDANKHRVLWGSDWPHTPRMKVRSAEEAKKETPFLDVNDETWLRSLRFWLSDEERHLLMVENPETLFGSPNKQRRI